MKINIPRDLLLIAAALFLWGLGEGMFAGFQVIYLQELGASPILIGAILSGIGIWMTVAQIPAGYLSDRFGPRPAMWAAWLLGTTAALVMALANSLPVFVFAMSLYGLTAFVSAPMAFYLTAVRGAWSVERAITVPNAFYNVGMAGGALTGGLIAGALGIPRIYAFSVGLFVLSTFVILLARPSPRQDAHHQATASRPNLFQNPRFLGLLGLVFVSMFALYLPQPLTPNFLQTQAGLSLQTIGMLGAVGSLGNAFFSLGMNGLRAPVAFIVGQALVAIYALLLWQGHGAGWYALGYFFMGGFRLARSMTLAYARQFIRSSETGLAYGLVETANSAVNIAAPFAAGLLYAANPYSVYPISLAAIGLIILINLFIHQRTKNI